MFYLMFPRKERNCWKLDWITNRLVSVNWYCGYEGLYVASQYSCEFWLNGTLEIIAT